MSSWIDQEPGWAEFHGQIGRLHRRSLSRPWRVTIFTLLAVAAIVGRQARKRELYRASVTFRVAERTGARGAESSAGYLTKQRLSEYLLDGVLTKERRLELIRRFNLYPRLRGSGGSDQLALDAFDEELKVKAFQNYFLRELWQHAGAPRSARVRISYSYFSPETALRVVRTMGEIVKRHEEAVRKELTELAAQRARAAFASIVRRLDRLEEQQAEAIAELQRVSGSSAIRIRLDLLERQIEKLRRAKLAKPTDVDVAVALRRAQDKQQMLRRIGLGRDRGPANRRGSNYEAELRVELGRLATSIARARLLRQGAAARKMEDEIRQGLERRRLLLRFEQADWSRAPTPILSRTLRLALLGAIGFFSLWPLIGLGVGAFDRRLHDVEDVAHLGFEPLGHLRRLPRGGALRGRLHDRGARAP